MPSSFLCKTRRFVLGVAGVALVTLAAAGAEARVDFEQEVRPIFERNCYECHGPKKRKGGLRLTNRKDAFTAGDLGIPVIDPGSAATSFLYEFVSSNDPEERMPKGRSPLSPEEIETLRRWIDEGAEWPEDDGKPRPFWAYRRPERPPLPRVADASWPRRPLDFFVLERLERAGLRPAPEAPPEVLLRRVHLDLTGIPPTPEEAAAFLRDPSPEAYERVVDRLLALPEFGERWASQWLDLARYADSTGFMSEVALTNWPYRDWAIRAINADMPFDEFTVEQLAGDLLPGADLAQRTATGFHRAAPLNLEAGVHEEDARIFQVIDRVNTTATVWLGTTFACAQCHDHKFDPISQEDYYRLLAFFNNTPKEAVGSDGMGGVNLQPRGPTIALPHIERTRQRGKKIAERFLDEVARGLEASIPDARPVSDDERAPVLAAGEAVDLEAMLSSASAILTARLVERDGPSWWRPWASWWKPWIAATREKLAAGEPRWEPLEVVSFSTSADDRYRVLDDGSVLLEGPPASQTTYVVELRTRLPRITGIRLETLRDPSLPGGGPGRQNPFQPDFILSELEVSTLEPAGPRPVALENTHATSFWRGGPPLAAIDGRIETGWAFTGSALKSDQALVAVASEPVEDAGGKRLRVVLRQEAGGGRSIGRLRLLATAADPTIVAMPAGLQQRMRDLPWDELSEGEQAVLLTLAQQSALPGAAAAFDRARRAFAELPDTPVAHVMVEEATPRETHVFVRGDHRDPGARVEPGTPSFLPPMRADLPRNRLGLARWLVDRDNPLTARVTVNRWWAQLFGQGIVATLDDFGIRGERPTHPELLDWLAVELVESGWRRKHMLRMIVTSATYRQSAIPADLDTLRTDPDNLLLARNERLRLPAESIRDNLLRVAGLLSLTKGGPPVYPPQPPNVWRSNGSTPARYVPSDGEDRYRRGVYTVWRRTSPYPSFVTFDAGDRTACQVRRSESNTPLQALTLLNDEVYVEAALAFADRILRERPRGTFEERLAFAYRVALTRAPRDQEAAVLRELIEARRREIESDPASVQALLAALPFTPRSHAEPSELASWFFVARAILNLDETIHRG